MKYQVKEVPDSDLPEGTDWALARVSEGIYLFVRESRFADHAGLCAILAAAAVARSNAWPDAVFSLVG
jgi:hypothetical protein